MVSSSQRLTTNGAIWSTHSAPPTTTQTCRLHESVHMSPWHLPAAAVVESHRCSSSCTAACTQQRLVPWVSCVVLKVLLPSLQNAPLPLQVDWPGVLCPLHVWWRVRSSGCLCMPVSERQSPDKGMTL